MQLNINIEAVSRTALVWLVIGGLGVFGALKEVSQKNRYAKEREAYPAEFAACKDRDSGTKRPDLDCRGRFGVYPINKRTQLDEPGVVTRIRSEEEIARDNAPSREAAHQKARAMEAQRQAAVTAEQAANEDKPGLVVIDSPGMGPNMALLGRAPMVAEIVPGSLADKAGLRKESSSAVWWLEAVNGKPTPNKAAVIQALAADGPLSVTIWKESVRQTITLRPVAAAAPASSAASAG